MESVTSFGLQHKICVHFTRPQVNRSYCQSSKHIPPISFALNKKTGADSTLAALRSEPGRFSAWAGYTSPLTLRFRPVTGRIAGHGSHTQTILNWGNKKPVSRMVASFLIQVSVVDSSITVSVDATNYRLIYRRILARIFQFVKKNFVVLRKDKNAIYCSRWRSFLLLFTTLLEYLQNTSVLSIIYDKRYNQKEK